MWALLETLDRLLRESAVVSNPHSEEVDARRDALSKKKSAGRGEETLEEARARQTARSIAQPRK